MLLHCTVYQDGRQVAQLQPEHIGAALQARDAQGAEHAHGSRFIWVALHDPTPEELAPLQAAFGLHPLAVEDALQGRQRPKLEEYGEDLFAVLHLLHFESPASPAARHKKAGPPPRLQTGQLAIFAGPRYVVSVRTHSEQSLAPVRERCEREPELLRQGPGFVLYALMDEVVDRYFPLTERIEDELEEIEKQIFTQGAGREIVQRLYALKRRLRLLRHAVAPLLEAAARLHGGRVPPLCAQAQHYFRDVFDHLSRLAAAIDGTRDSLTTAIQVNLSLVTIDDSDVTKRLAAWAAIFGVCTAFVGVWGMNFDAMPELHWRWGYPAALGLIGAVCVLLYVRFRRAGWL
ncbi:magnesium and cobalt transport protein CorA [Xenophilus arseniciresistens]|uniref:Magnesium and cobalt transport protein CorA n=1 Tax=Xenophilus arseniciresistens TaxID=1283306 RepID=A0AAE3T1Y5_9BURK|nr:magnesium and cobalt transport protein CorA [Xenophilus arseniciresistens]MDA7417862.1 magnesium and cobalt transport protein CorA [Xenophilus arseniciresistens]